MLSQAVVLLLSSNTAETRFLEMMLSKHVALLEIVRNLSELQKVLKKGSYDAALCAWSVKPGTWAKAFEQIQQCHPEMPVIIFRQPGSEEDWIKVLQAGAFDLLQAPYEEQTFLGVLEHAVASSDARRRHGPCQPKSQGKLSEDPSARSDR